ncbi:MAG: hypothetical protein H7Y61_09645, partial [Rhizobiales bacterium]|nr:hypothetical protein [Rhizobacter sp.]
AEQHRRAFIKQLNDYHTANGKFDDWSFTAGPDLWALAPAFSHEGSALLPALKSQAGHFAVLAAWFAGAWALALFAIRRTSTEALG